MSAEVRPLGNTAAPSNAGGFVLTISPEAFMPRDEFDRRLGALVTTIRGSAPAKRSDHVMVPGDRYWRGRERRMREGIEIGADVHRELLELAGRSS